MTKEQIDALFERLNPEPIPDCEYECLTLDWRFWQLMREGFRQAMGLLEPTGELVRAEFGGRYLRNVPPLDNLPEKTALYRIREDRK